MIDIKLSQQFSKKGIINPDLQMKTGSEGLKISQGNTANKWILVKEELSPKPVPCPLPKEM